MISSCSEFTADDGNYSLLEFKKFKCVWNIRNSDLKKGLRSDSGDDSNKEYPWYLIITRVIYFNSSEFFTMPFQRVKEIHVELCLKDSPMSEVLAMFSFVLKQSDNEIYKTNGRFLFSKAVSQSPAYCIPLESIDDDDFKILAELHIEDSSKPTIMEHNCQLQHMRDMLVSLQNDDYSDMVIKVDGKEIKCHKCILSGRSSYFSTLLKSGFNESKNNRIEITDFDYETIKNMINFFYSFECPKLPMEPTMNLLEASHKYLITDLKDICEKRLMSMIDASNALDVLLHADTYSADKIKKRAMDFICENPADFEKAEQHEALISRPYLLRELLLVTLKAKNTTR